MKQIFKLNGLCCANCAAKIEERVGKLSGVNTSSINFITTKLTIEAEDEKMPGIIEAAKAIIKKLEPDIVMENA